MKFLHEMAYSIGSKYFQHGAIWKVTDGWKNQIQSKQNCSKPLTKQALGMVVLPIFWTGINL